MTIFNLLWNLSFKSSEKRISRGQLDVNIPQICHALKRYFITLTAELTQGAESASFNTGAFDSIKGAHVVAIRTRFGGKTINKKTVCSAAVGAVCTLELKENGITRHEVPLSLVEHLSSNGFSAGMPVGYVVTLSESKITVQDTTLPTTGEVVELIFEIEK
jgi:hypothetical protein